MASKKQGKYRFQDFEVDLAKRTLRRDGRAVTISARTFDLLMFLLRNSRRVVSKEELLAALWPGADVEESNLGQHVFLLRKALTGSQPGDKLLVSVPGKGYQLTAEVVDLTPPDTDPGERKFLSAIEPKRAEPPAEDEEAPVLRSRAKGKREDEDEASPAPVRSMIQAVGRFFSGFRQPGLWHWIGLTGLMLLVLVIAAVLWRSRHRPAPQAFAVVIADFENTTGNPDFDGALKTALTVDLQQSPFLTVSSQGQGNASSGNGKAAALSPDTTLRADQARELCSRIGDQAYITGNVRRAVQKYLVTIQVFDCSNGDKLAGSIGIADSPDAVVSVLDRVAVDLRRQLGEASDSIDRFNKPLFAQRPASLEALKAYADGNRFQQSGKFEESITLLRRAVELDPQFALAFGDLGTAYSTLGQKSLADASMNAAYQLRDTVGELNRLAIAADYHRLVTGDLLASIRNDKQWREEYPRDPIPLNDLGEIEIDIGAPALAIEAAQRSLELNPANTESYLVLALAQLHLGQVDEAATTCRKAIAQHVDTTEMHALLYQIGFLRLDQPAMDEQMAWGKSHGAGSPEESYMMTQQGLMEFAQGKVKAAQAIFAHLIQTYRSQNQEELANRIAGELPRIEAELGYLESALAQLERLPEIHGSVDIPVAWAHTGETSRAEAILKRELNTYPMATLWQEDLAPQVKAAIALNQHQPDAAIAALQPAQQFDLRSFDVPAMTGRAYLAAKKPAEAEAAFRKIIDHPGIEPLSYNYPLAQLGLARALAAQGKLVDASQVYKVVLAIWKDADPDLLRLRDAKAEYAKLGGTVVGPTPKPTPKLSSKTSPTGKKPAASRR
jgi:DNA-binding winged helix-turn-helix (wHTH) protein/tetratricopeptide (TPR) repeat protein